MRSSNDWVISIDGSCGNNCSSYFRISYRSRIGRFRELMISIVIFNVKIR